MTTLTVLPEGKTIEVSEGTTLLAALLGAEIAILHKCEGQAKCGSCHIFVQEGRKGLSPQDWFNFLSDKAGDVYQTLAGGRGVFRLTRAELDALKQAAAPAAA